MSKNSNDIRPELILVHKRDLGVNELLMDPLLNTLRNDEEPPPVPAKMGTKLSWEVNEKVCVVIHRAWNVNVVSTNNVSVIQFCNVCNLKRQIYGYTQDFKYSDNQGHI